jgi:hypothetical protein
MLPEDRIVTDARFFKSADIYFKTFYRYFDPGCIFGNLHKLRNAI